MSATPISNAATMSHSPALTRAEGRSLNHPGADYPDDLLVDVHNSVQNDDQGSDEAETALYEPAEMRLWLLYISHFLSTWNTRTYEFAAILFFANNFPDTLLPTSLRGVLVNLSTLCLSSTIGRWIDFSKSRLRPLQVTIILQRTCISFACGFWALNIRHALPSKKQSSVGNEPVGNEPAASGVGGGQLMIIIIVIMAGVVESLCAVGNNLCMERDWVPAISSPTSSPSLYVLSANMKRIDLISKLTAPAFVSAMHSWTGSATILAIVLAVQNMVSIAPEWLAVRKFWRSSASLRKPRSSLHVTEATAVLDSRELVKDFKLYFGTDIWIPSLSSALQSASILAMSGLMTTHLVSVGYSLSLITTVRILSSIVELAPTALVPRILSWLSQDDPDPLGPLSQIGVCGLGLQTVCLLPPTIWLLFLQPAETDARSVSSLGAGVTTFFLFLTLSRFGAWTHNLIAQNIVQISVPAENTARFSGVEMSFVSAAEIFRWSLGAVWSQPSQFPTLSTTSFFIVLFDCAIFAIWGCRRRIRQLGCVRLGADD